MSQNVVVLYAETSGRTSLEYKGWHLEGVANHRIILPQEVAANSCQHKKGRHRMMVMVVMIMFIIRYLMLEETISVVVMIFTQ